MPSGNGAGSARRQNASAIKMMEAWLDHWLRVWAVLVELYAEAWLCDEISKEKPKPKEREEQ
jgi:hypothetical protein